MISKGRDIIGEDAQRMTQGSSSLIHPMSSAGVRDWDAMEKIWRHTFFNGLRVNPKDYKVICTEPYMHSTKDRERMCQIMFETFKVQGFYLANENTMACFACGKDSGKSELLE